mgnify:FL=1
MAIINQGQVLLTGEPLEAIRSLDGRVWKKVVSKDELPDVQLRLTMLSTRLVGGRPVVHVLSDTQPEPGFEQVAAGLEDVYFGQLTRHRASLAA